MGIVTHTDMINVYVNILEEQALLIHDNTELRALSCEPPLLVIPPCYGDGLYRYGDEELLLLLYPTPPLTEHFIGQKL